MSSYITHKISMSKLIQQVTTYNCILTFNVITFYFTIFLGRGPNVLFLVPSRPSRAKGNNMIWTFESQVSKLKSKFI